jgi:hypothetical protein
LTDLWRKNVELVQFSVEFVHAYKEPEGLVLATTPSSASGIK